MPFKFIKFDEKKNNLKSTTIIKDVKQSYAFVSAITNMNTSYSSHSKTKEATIPTRRSFSELWKDDEICNNTTDTFINKLESMDLYYGIIPSKYWCMKCKEDVISDVKMNLPTLSVWNRLCCNSCYSPNDKFQEIIHKCPRCKKLLEKFTPKLL
ncbi:hypothetical protein SteCoe_36465 [Stentor coeruleus]|uniref:LITAF domain-containing protein n=1 Tax=Stentor coeruleus TaxID=5963 RepID=A0A1R2AQF0_9CILI|nr:hypothetical protein SteCoe_36465 [Stentor coeruleus]